MRAMSLQSITQEAKVEASISFLENRATREHECKYKILMK